MHWSHSADFTGKPNFSPTGFYYGPRTDVPWSWHIMWKKRVEKERENNPEWKKSKPEVQAPTEVQKELIRVSEKALQLKPKTMSEALRDKSFGRILEIEREEHKKMQALIATVNTKINGLENALSSTKVLKKLKTTTPSVRPTPAEQKRSKSSMDTVMGSSGMQPPQPRALSSLEMSVPFSPAASATRALSRSFDSTAPLPQISTPPRRDTSDAISVLSGKRSILNVDEFAKGVSIKQNFALPRRKALELLKEKLQGRLSSGPNELRRAFKVFDKGGHGYITWENFCRVLENFGMGDVMRKEVGWDGDDSDGCRMRYGFSTDWTRMEITKLTTMSLSRSRLMRSSTLTRCRTLMRRS